MLYHSPTIALAPSQSAAQSNTPRGIRTPGGIKIPLSLYGLIMKPVLPAFFVGLLLGWLGSPHVPSSPVSQYSPLPLPPGASNVEPKAPPPGWDKILDKRFRQYTNNPADCPKYAVRYNKALLEIYQTGENEYYCIFPPVME